MIKHSSVVFYLEKWLEMCESEQCPNFPSDEWMESWKELMHAMNMGCETNCGGDVSVKTDT